MFHFQRGDGRRGGRKIPLVIKKRIERSVSEDGRSEIAQVRLTHSLQVLPVAYGVEPVASSMEFLRQTEPLPSDVDGQEELRDRKLCVTSFSLVSSIFLVLVTVFSLMMVVVYLGVKYNAAKKQLAKIASRN